MTGVKIFYGYFITCMHDFLEPEGTVMFDHRPVAGEKVILCDKKEWTVWSVNHEELTATVIP